MASWLTSLPTKLFALSQPPELHISTVQPKPGQAAIVRAGTNDEINYIPNPPPGPSHGPIKVIYGGMMRMGSLSMAHAFATLGFRTHHLLEDGWEVWHDLYRAACATFPRPGEHPEPFTRQDWHRMLGGFDAVTDMAGYFVPQLLEAYPDAKVVVVQRDFDKWWESYESEVAAPNHPKSEMVQFAILAVFDGLLGLPAGGAMKRIMHGWFRADDLAGMRENARARYEEHYAWMRANVPKERLLEYKLGDGWEPLAKFLGKDVPAVEFPRVNDQLEHRKRTGERLAWLLPILRRRLLKGLGLLVVVLAVMIPLWRSYGR